MKSKTLPWWRSKYVIGAFILGLLVGAVLVLRLDEDNWLCQKGQWVKHGNPATQMPITPCE